MSAPICHRQGHIAPTHLRFDRHVQQTRQRAYNLAYHLLGNPTDAEDVIQDAYARAWQHFDAFDCNRAFEPWLFRIITNRVIDICRRRKRLFMSSLDAPIHVDADGPPIFAAPDSNPEQIVLASIQEERVEQAFATLSRDYQEALLLLTREQLSYEEIAHRLNCPAGTVRARIHRARTQLRAALPLPNASLTNTADKLALTVRTEPGRHA